VNLPCDRRYAFQGEASADADPSTGGDANEPPPAEDVEVPPSTTAEVIGQDDQVGVAQTLKSTSYCILRSFQPREDGACPTERNRIPSRWGSVFGRPSMFGTWDISVRTMVLSWSAGALLFIVVVCCTC